MDKATYVNTMREEIMVNRDLIARCDCKGRCIYCVQYAEENDAMEASIMRYEMDYN